MSMYSVATTKLRSFAIAGLLVASTTAIAQTIKWDMTEAFPPTSISGIAAGDFARLVKEKSGGKIEITVHYSGSLGLGERDILTAVVTEAAPHHLVTDGLPISIRKTRGGDAAEERKSCLLYTSPSPRDS